MACHGRLMVRALDRRRCEIVGGGVSEASEAEREEERDCDDEVEDEAEDEETMTSGMMGRRWIDVGHKLEGFAREVYAGVYLCPKRCYWRRVV